MTESLIAILIAGFTSMIIGMIMQSTASLVSVTSSIQNELGILQLRQRAAQSSTCSCEENALVMIRNHEKYIYKFNNGRVIQSPGYEIIIEPAKKAEFVCEGNKVFLETESTLWQIR